MKRDMELVRKLLFYFEERESVTVDDDVRIDGYDNLTIGYHLLLMAQAGLIDFEPELTDTGRIIKVYPFGLSWTGHEFLDTARSDSLWNKAVNTITEKTGGASLDLLIEVLTGMAKEQLGIGGQ